MQIKSEYSVYNYCIDYPLAPRIMFGFIAELIYQYNQPYR